MPSKKGKSKSNTKANAAANSNPTQSASNLPNGAPTVPDEAAPQAPPSDKTIEPKPLQEREEQMQEQEQTQEHDHEHKDEGSSGQSRKEEQKEQDDVPVNERIRILENDLEATRQEKEALGNQYRSLLGKLTAMRTTLGDKLKEDAEELDRRETQINNLVTENSELHETVDTLRSELSSLSQESSHLSAQLAQLRSQSDSSSSDVLSLTREMRELRGEMERLRLEREEWEVEAGRERERRETLEDDLRVFERREQDMCNALEKLAEERDKEKERGDNLQEVLSEFQAAKDSEIRQATTELETQLRTAAESLSEFKLRAANAETRLSEVSSDASKSTALEKELKDKNQIIGKLRHDAVVSNEHLKEALRRLRKNQSDNNVDRRLVTNILLSFLMTSRGDPKRFEMLSLLATILSWDDAEREKAGLQRQGAVGGGGKGKASTGKGKETEKSAEEEAAMNESFSNLFVEFLLKEASQGQPSQTGTSDQQPRRTLSSLSLDSPPMFSPPHGPAAGSMTFSPPSSSPRQRPREMSSSSSVSEWPMMMGGRKGSLALKDVMEGQGQTYHS
ncbi:hypothetical protein LQV05_002773 [Cryptococcus neoformans]|nr:hypothetical protein J007_01822 [Cryptococcus neoformans var. grubii]OXC62824.1 hypothetical protein C358_01829 [Cryptococcus neoformans var. grubii MW-RSA852]UOH80124.1 hypothetical protein LQV05_002773 [Cryptococcus neoformans]